MLSVTLQVLADLKSVFLEGADLKNFVAKACRVIIDDVEKLDVI